MDNVLTILLAGGAGERLYPLTQDRAKPAVPFGGVYRIIDITLSNCVNSGLRKIFILTQYKALSLNRHLRLGWNILSPEMGEFIEVIPPMQRVSDTWYLGTADAVFQNIYSILVENPDYVLILAADHIYKMNYNRMLEEHRRRGADITVGTIPQPVEDAHRFGVVQSDAAGRITGFLEKPKGKELETLGGERIVQMSMGIYLFTASKLIEMLRADAQDPNSAHDFGRNILPSVLNECRVFTYPFVDENNQGPQYWRDVGTLDAYYEANMDLISVSPVFNLYDKDWPIRTLQLQHPPAKFIFAQEGYRMGVALDSIVSHGTIVSGGRVLQSVLSPDVRVNSYSEVQGSILFMGVDVGRYSRLRRCIVERGVHIPDNTQIGYDLERDRARGFVITDSGLVVVGRPGADGGEESDAIAVLPAD
ncbi:MAG: glucose-1-phosphate adenylyltransferase [Acidobacteria bacterium]|nr:glucose-1-phosphate adenylyltransferase [Acidobacteriota bacterium]